MSGSQIRATSLLLLQGGKSGFAHHQHRDRSPSLPCPPLPCPQSTSGCARSASCCRRWASCAAAHAGVCWRAALTRCRCAGSVTAEMHFLRWELARCTPPLHFGVSPPLTLTSLLARPPCNDAPDERGGHQRLLRQLPLLCARHCDAVAGGGQQSPLLALGFDLQ